MVKFCLKRSSNLPEPDKGDIAKSRPRPNSLLFHQTHRGHFHIKGNISPPRSTLDRHSRRNYVFISVGKKGPLNMPPKRKTEATAAEPVAKRRSARQAEKSFAATAAAPENEAMTLMTADAKGGRGRGAGKSGTKTEDAVIDAPRRVAKDRVASKPAKPAPKPKAHEISKGENEGGEGGARAMSEDPDIESIPARNPEVERHEGEWFWLMKAEPEPRFENGIDVSFSIDDLRAREVPEPWDGELPL